VKKCKILIILKKPWGKYQANGKKRKKKLNKNIKLWLRNNYSPKWKKFLNFVKSLKLKKKNFRSLLIKLWPKKNPKNKGNETIF
jgi:hypothetical protein